MPRLSQIHGLLPALLFSLTCASAPAVPGWREVAPLPERRWFHVAATDGDGRLYAFAGKAWAEGDRSRYGLKTFAIRIFDPEENAWRAGAPPPRIHARHRSTREWRRAGDITGEPIRVEAMIHDYQMPLPHELPQGVGGADGRVYWFGEVAPIVYDAKEEEWVQDAIPVSDNDRARLRKDTWISSVPRFDRQNAVTAAAPDGKIYVVGGLGYPVLRHERSSDPQNLYALLDSVEVYDPATQTWEERAPLLRARQHFAGAFGPDGKLYVFGGYGHKGVVRPQNHPDEEAFQQAVREMKALGNEALRSVEIYDPATDSWSEGAPMPAGRHAMGAALGADGRIYVVGGAVKFSSPYPQEEVFVYDPATDTWTEGPDLQHARFHHAVAGAPGGRIYAVGGIGRRGWLGTGPTATVEVLDTARQAPRPTPQPAPPDRG